MERLTDQLATFLLTNWPRFFDTPHPNSLSVSLRVSPRKRVPMRLFLIHDTEQVQPIAVVRSYVSRDNAGLLARYEKAAHSFGRESCRHCRLRVPAPQHLLCIEGVACLMEPFVPGSTLLTLLDAAPGNTDIQHNFAECLGQLALATAKYRRFTHEEFEKLVLLPLKAIKDWLPSERSRLIDANVDVVMNSTRKLLGKDIPFVLTHGDLWPENILVQPEANDYCLVDLERAEIEYPAGYDLIYFLVHAGPYPDRRDPLSGFAAAFAEQGEWQHFVQLRLAEYIDAIGMAAEMQKAIIHLWIVAMDSLITRTISPFLRDKVTLLLEKATLPR